MNSKQNRTLMAIFSTPVRSDIEWNDVVSLFIALGATVTQGKGSRVRVLLNDETAVFHKPHPEKEMGKGAVKFVREFLENAGIEPEE